MVVSLFQELELFVFFSIAGFGWSGVEWVGRVSVKEMSA